MLQWRGEAHRSGRISSPDRPASRPAYQSSSTRQFHHGGRNHGHTHCCHRFGEGEAGSGPGGPGSTPLACLLAGEAEVEERRWRRGGGKREKVGRKEKVGREAAAAVEGVMVGGGAAPGCHPQVAQGSAQRKGSLFFVEFLHAMMEKGKKQANHKWTAESPVRQLGPSLLGAGTRDQTLVG